MLFSFVAVLLVLSCVVLCCVILSCLWGHRECLFYLRLAASTTDTVVFACYCASEDFGYEHHLLAVIFRVSP